MLYNEIKTELLACPSTFLPALGMVIEDRIKKEFGVSVKTSHNTTSDAIALVRKLAYQTLGTGSINSFDSALAIIEQQHT